MSGMARRHLYPALAIGLFVFHVGANILFLRGDLDLGQKDVASHLKVQTKFYLQMRDLLRAGAGPWAIFRNGIALFHQESMPEEHVWMWPRLTYLAASPLIALMGLSPRVIIISNTLWLGILILSIYLIAAYGMDPQAGFVSALAVSFFPSTYGLAHRYGLDFPLMAMCAFGTYWLMKTESFSHRGASVTFGCTLGLGLLVKPQLIIFLCGPLAWAFWRGVIGVMRRRGGSEEAGSGVATPMGRLMLNVIIAGVCAAALSSLFWWGNLRNIIDVFVKHATKIEEFGNVDINREYLATFSLSPQYFIYYAVVAIVYVSPVFIAGCMLFLPCFLRSAFRAKALIILWILVPYALWTRVQFKYDVYYFGSLPAFSVILGVGIASVKRSRVRLALTLATAAWGLLHFWALSFGAGPGPYAHCRPFSGVSIDKNGYPTWARPAFPDSLEATALRFDEVVRRMDGDNRYLRIGLLEFEYSERDYRLVEALEYLLENFNPSLYVYRSFFSPDSFLECMGSFNYLILLQKGVKTAPDFTCFEEYFLFGRGAGLRGRYLNTESFLGLSRSYRRYEHLGSAVLSPEGVTAFLLGKPPYPIGESTIVPATYCVSTNLYIAYPHIGIDKNLLHTPAIGDYDVLFPYDLDFPLVPPRRRKESEPYFATYRLRIDSPGRYSLFVDGPGAASAHALHAGFGGLPLMRKSGSPGATGIAGPFYLGEFIAERGDGALTLIGGDSFPVIDKLIIQRVYSE
jgi:hypothetical protein